MKRVRLSKREAGKLAMQGQFSQRENLNRENRDDDVNASSDVISQLGHVQIDTISVVQRAHHHVIWNRNRDYEPSHLDLLQNSPRKIFEYWTHAASFLPVSHYRFCLPRMRRLKKEGFEWFQRDKRIMRYVLDKIKNEGPKQTRDFEDLNHKPGPWWGWKPAKIALEHLFMEGTLSVAKRVNFHKVYDLTERVLPRDTNTRMPTKHQMANYLLEKAQRSLRLVAKKDILFLRKDGREEMDNAIAKKLNKKEITAVNIDGVRDTYYVKTSDLKLLDPSSTNHDEPVARILSPFDNFTINRKRLKDIFDFDYQLECFVPAAKRKYGYFSLPLLFDNGFVGIMDAKAERKDGILRVKNLYLEKESFNPGGIDAETFFHYFSKELRAFAKFNGCGETKVEKVHPSQYSKLVG